MVSTSSTQTVGCAGLVQEPTPWEMCAVQLGQPAVTRPAQSVTQRVTNLKHPVKHTRADQSPSGVTMSKIHTQIFSSHDLNAGIAIGHNGTFGVVFIQRCWALEFAQHSSHPRPQTSLRPLQRCRNQPPNPLRHEPRDEFPDPGGRQLARTGGYTQFFETVAVISKAVDRPVFRLVLAMGKGHESQPTSHQINPITDSMNTGKPCASMSFMKYTWLSAQSLRDQPRSLTAA